MQSVAPLKELKNYFETEIDIADKILKVTDRNPYVFDWLWLFNEVNSFSINLHIKMLILTLHETQNTHAFNHSISPLQISNPKFESDH